MILWMSGEVMADVGRDYLSCRKIIESKVNERLAQENILPAVVQWFYIATIRDDSLEPYREVCKKSAGSTIFEFRLKISHLQFKEGSEELKMSMIIESLMRSVDLMSKFGVSIEDRNKIKSILMEQLPISSGENLC